MGVETISRIESPVFNAERSPSGIWTIRSDRFAISFGATHIPLKFFDMEREMAQVNGSLPVLKAGIGQNLVIIASREIDLQINGKGELQTHQSRSFAHGSILSYWGESLSVNGESKFYGQYARRFTESSRGHMHPKPEHYFWASGEALIKIENGLMLNLNESRPYLKVPSLTPHQVKTVGHELLALIICEDPLHLY